MLYCRGIHCAHEAQMLAYGCTRLEIGLQSTYEDVARDTNRGHTVGAVGTCFRLAKNAGFKVTALLRFWRMVAGQQGLSYVHLIICGEPDPINCRPECRPDALVETG